MTTYKMRVILPLGIILLLLIAGIGVLIGVYTYAEAQSAEKTCGTTSNSLDQCIPTTQCKAIMHVIQKYPEATPADLAKKLKKYVCVFEQNITSVCCPSGPIHIENETDKATTLLPSLNSTGRTSLRILPEESSTSSSSSDVSDGVNLRGSPEEENIPATPPDVTDHMNLRLLPEDCGYVRLDDKIRNGKNAGLREFPWMALINFNTTKGPWFGCGGTIINDRYILTAAHCLVGVPPLLNVRVGEYDLSSETDCNDEKCRLPFQDVAVEKILPHEEYDSISYDNDVGLIRVSKIELATGNTETVCLPITEELANAEFKRGSVTGWGFTQPNGTRHTGILQKVDLPIRNLTACIHAYRYTPWLRFSHKQLCVGDTDNKDSCRGDSGGPLQVAAFFNDENRYVQQGIVSYGVVNCGKPGYPGIYTKVAYFMKWILDNIEP